MAEFDAFFTSPLRGEVGANAPGEGFSACFGHMPFTTAQPLTPTKFANANSVTLSPQGRGGEGAAASAGQENSHGTA